MKAIILALLFGLVLLAAISCVLRLSRTEKRARAMLFTFLSVLPLLIVVHACTPADLWCLPAELAAPVAWVDLGFSIFLYGVGFFGGILQLYNLADRGFSLRILIDVLETPAGAMRLDDVMTGYSAGRGIGWMYDKRIHGMVEAGLVRVEGGSLMLTERGRRTADLFGRLRDFARLSSGPGGDR